MKKQLLEMIINRSLEFGDFVLSSGIKSDYYIDGKRTTFDPKGAYLVGKIIFEKIKNIVPMVDSIGGLTMGADPIASAVGLVSFLEGQPIKPFSVRKEPKRHGRRRWIEGSFDKGDNAIVVEDVITTGDSTIKAIRAIEEEGGNIIKVICIVDRCQGGRENIQSLGYEVDPIFRIDEIIEKAKPKKASHE